MLCYTAGYNKLTPVLNFTGNIVEGDQIMMVIIPCGNKDRHANAVPVEHNLFLKMNEFEDFALKQR